MDGQRAPVVDGTIRFRQFENRQFSGADGNRQYEEHPGQSDDSDHSDTGVSLALTFEETADRSAGSAPSLRQVCARSASLRRRRRAFCREEQIPIFEDI
jgi:hypothetical protein